VAAAGPISRRDLCLLLGTVGAAVLTSHAGARIIPKHVPWYPGHASPPRAFDGARFFTNDERRCIDALTARLIPTDETGPGAREAGVVDFIDNQLAGFYGRGDRWYMQGPFAKGTDEQGYQSHHPPAQLYRAAISALDDHCRKTFDGKVFAELSEQDQDAIVKQLDDGKLALSDVPAETFFKILQENSIEGFFCDPVYGGNRDMVGWRLVGFPGARYDYRDFLDHNGAAISIEPVGLRGRPAWNPE